MRRVLALAAAPLVLVACGGAAGGSGAATPGASSAERTAIAGAPPPPSGAPHDIDCGDFTTCVLAGEGEPRCWGRDKAGELGDGGGESRAKNVPIPALGKVRQVALASQFGCAITDDRHVECWGTGRIANDGKGYTSARPMAVASVAGAEEIAASGVLACARTAGGVVCWGSDEATVAASPKGSFAQIAVGFTHACALDGKGAVSCWGSGDWGAKGALASPGITGARHLATGDRHACVVTRDRKVKCWGNNDAGQLGTKPDATPHKKPVDVKGVSGAVRLAAGEASTCALLEGGSVMCWGANNEGELGLGSRSSDERPTKVAALPEVASMCLGSTHGCAVTRAGKVVCWGANAHGELGDGTKERRMQPADIEW